MILALAIFAVALGAYVPYALGSRPRGGSVPGLVYGAAGYGMMLFAGLLGARKAGCEAISGSGCSPCR